LSSSENACGYPLTLGSGEDLVSRLQGGCPEGSAAAVSRSSEQHSNAGARGISWTEAVNLQDVGSARHDNCSGVDWGAAATGSTALVPLCWIKLCITNAICASQVLGKCSVDNLKWGINAIAAYGSKGGL